MIRLSAGDCISARTIAGAAPTFVHDARVRGVAVDPPWPAGLVLVEHEGFRSWCRASSARRLRRAPARVVEVDGVSWEPMTY